jgi:hypothetical protein
MFGSWKTWIWMHIDSPYPGLVFCQVGSITRSQFLHLILVVVRMQNFRNMAYRITITIENSDCDLLNLGFGNLPHIRGSHWQAPPPIISCWVVLKNAGGRGHVNWPGVMYYNRLIDYLLLQSKIMTPIKSIFWSEFPWASYTSTVWKTITTWFLSTKLRWHCK